jgi:FkbM family methyltransferase
MDPISNSIPIESQRKAMLDSLFHTKWDLEEIFFGSHWTRRMKRWLYFFPFYLKFFLTERHLIPEKVLAFNTFWGRKFFIHSGDMESILLTCESKRLVNAEARLSLYLIKHLKTSDCFYDAGAAFGFYTMLAMDLSVGQIHAFEPDTRIFRDLQKNALGASNVFTNNTALSDQDGDAVLFKNTKGSATNSIIPEVAETYKSILHAKYHNEPVKTVTLDQYTTTNTPPTFVKIDVEGGESLVIKGGRQTFAKYHPTIAMEVWGGERGETFSKKGVDLLQQLGYKAFKISETGEAEPMSIVDYFSIKSLENLIFMHQ